MRATKTWIFIGDGSRARIVENDGPGKGLQPALDKEFKLPQMRTGEMGADRPSTRGGMGGQLRHGVEPKTDWHEQEKESFAREMADMLTEAAGKKQFDRLVLVAPPAFLGAMRAKLGAAAQDLISGELAKDLTHVSLHDLPGHLEDTLAV